MISVRRKEKNDVAYEEEAVEERNEETKNRDRDDFETVEVSTTPYKVRGSKPYVEDNVPGAQVHDFMLF